MTHHQWGGVLLFDLDREKVLRHLTIDQAETEASPTAFSRDGRLLAGGSADGTVWLWRADTAEVLLPLEGHKVEVRAVAFSPDGRLLPEAKGDKAKGEGQRGHARFH